MSTSDKRRKLVYGKKKAGNPTAKFDLTIGEEEIKIRPVVDGLTILEFTEIPQAEEGEELSEEDARLASKKLLQFFRRVVVDYDAFSEAVAASGVEIEELGQMAADLVEAYTERPTVPPPTS